MNEADIEALENRARRFIEGEKSYMEHLRALQDELRQMRREIEASRRTTQEILRWVEVPKTPRWDEVPDEVILAHPEAQKSEWEGV